jgi:predicted nucleotidyltransferase
MHLNQLRQLAKRLAEEKVEFVLVGGYAVMTHGSALITQDMDIALRMIPENIQKLGEILADLNPYHRQTPKKIPLDLQAQELKSWKNLYLGTDWGQLDCLGEVLGIGDYDAVLAKSELIDLGDFQMRILTLDALIEAKKAMDRPRDIHAVHELEAIRALKNRPPP